MTERSASERYRDITGRVDEAVRRMRQMDRERAHELFTTVRETRRALEDAEEQLRSVQSAMTKYWQMAGQALYNERWLQMRPMPKPLAGSNTGTPASELLKKVEAAYAELAHALRKRSFIRRRG